MMKYCEDTTLTHPLSIRYSEQVTPIARIFKKDGNAGYKTTLFADEKAIDLDAVEIKRCRQYCSNEEPTMDMAIGLSKKGKEKNILLVELKLNVKKVSKIEGLIKDVSRKIDHSVELLGRTVPINEVKVVVFPDRMIKEGRSVFVRVLEKLPKNISIEVKTAKEFKDIFF